jgi:hypothetical protein
MLIDLKFSEHVVWDPTGQLKEGNGCRLAGRRTNLLAYGCAVSHRCRRGQRPEGCARLSEGLQRLALTGEVLPRSGPGRGRKRWQGRT